ncbi:MAG: winged helix-turn-helix domain-containing protein [Bryobacteraceae bacterium]
MLHCLTALAMKAGTGSRARYRFGNFEVSPDLLEIKKGGIRLKLREQPFQILVAMLERPGELVTRDDLRSRLWPADIFVDFNKRVNTAVNQLREALCDSASQPRFIETIPRHGYRFIAEVKKLETLEQAAPVAQPQGAKPEQQITVGSIAGNEIRAKHWPRFPAVVSLCTLAVIAISWFNRPLAPPRLTNTVQITGDGRPKMSLVSDGKRLYFAGAAANLSNWQIFQTSASGGDALPFPTTVPGMNPLDISPDRSELLVMSTALWDTPDGWQNPSALFTQPVIGGPPKRLGQLTAQDAAWSPDGKQIAYAKLRDIALASRDGSFLRTVATLPGSPYGLRWSPDGTRLRFTLHYGTAHVYKALWEVSRNGGDPHPLFPAWKDPQTDGCWTPDGAFYVFAAVSKGVSYIWALPEKQNLFSTGQQSPVQLTTGPMQTYLPTPSPDGKQLFIYGLLQRGEIIRYDAKIRNFVSILPGVSAMNVNFSRDGKRITYNAYPDHALWRSMADGSQRLQLSPPHMLTYLPRISPDGSRIAFTGALPGGPAAIYIVPFDGGTPQAIEPTAAHGVIEPVWSPDGTSLALGTSATQYDPPEQTLLYQFGLNANHLSALPGSERLWSPRWSPDGRYLAALEFPETIIKLYDLKMHTQTQLTNVPAAYPSWSRDGQFVYFRSSPSDEAWYRVQIRDRKLERLVSLKNVTALAASPSRGPAQIGTSWWVGLAPDDSLLLTREVGSLEIYSLDWTTQHFPL